MITINYDAKYKNNTAKQQTLTTSAVVLTPPALTDSVKNPENIFIQALSTNSSPFTIGFSSAVTSNGAGIQLVAGASINLPSHRFGEIYLISAAGGEKANIIYSSGIE